MSATGLSKLQEAVFTELKRICVNYKKDGPSRKTLQYLEDRLSQLNATWEKFVSNHQLLEESGVMDLQYFTEAIFTNTKRMYEDVLQDILKLKSELTSASATTTTEKGKLTTKFSFEGIDFHVPPRETNDTTEKQQDLLRQQYCNFKVFERFAEKINLTLPLEKWELEDHLATLKTKFEYIEKANWQLDYILQDDDSVYKQKYLAAENLYDELRKKIQNSIWGSRHYEKSTPKLELNDFHGNYNQWLSFRDLYIESIHNNPLLSKAQKMQHLKAKLKGDAEKLVQHLGITADNYDSCWELLTHRYNNKRLLLNSYIKTLLNQPTIQEASAASIRNLHDVMMECLNGLKNIGLDITTWDPIVTHLLMQKLDSITYNEYMKAVKAPRELSDLEEFIQFLETRFMALEALQGSQTKLLTSNKPWRNDRPLVNATYSQNIKLQDKKKPNILEPEKAFDFEDVQEFI